MTRRIHRLLDGRHVDLASILEVDEVDVASEQPLSLSFKVRFELLDNPVSFGFDRLSAHLAAAADPQTFGHRGAGLILEPGNPSSRKAMLEVAQLVRDDLLQAWKAFKDSARTTADPIFRFADGTNVDLSSVLDVSAPAVFEGDAYGFSILYRGHPERRFFSYNCYDHATAELLGLDFEEALASPHGDPDRVALAKLGDHVDALVGAWREFKQTT